jgi:hypothetical protein
MRNCMNITATIWPTLSVAKATRQSRLSQGRVVSLGHSKSYGGQRSEARLDKQEVSR